MASLSLKRVVDVVISVLALLFFSPLMLVVAMLLSIDGGVLYRQKRVGRDGNLIKIFKFRTMVVNNESILNDYFEKYPEEKLWWERERKLRDDPRVTSLGRVLRALSVDELPQLVSVLLGDMAIVGPRPVVPEELNNYRRSKGRYLSVKPGITGLWQVSGRNDVSYTRRVALDRWYVANRTFCLDCLIMLRTVKVVLKSNGAY